MYLYKALVVFIVMTGLGLSISMPLQSVVGQDHYYFEDPPTPWNNYHGGYPPDYGAHAGSFYGGGYDGWLGYGAFDGYGIYHHHRYFRAW